MEARVGLAGIGRALAAAGGGSGRTQECSSAREAEREQLGLRQCARLGTWLVFTEHAYA